MSVPLEHDSKRTRSSGPSDGNMLKKIRAEPTFSKCSTVEKVLKGDDPSTMSQVMTIIRAAPACGTEGDNVRPQGGGVHAEPQGRCCDPAKGLNERVKHPFGGTQNKELENDLAMTLLTNSTVRMIHVTYDSHSKYGLKFIRKPSNEEVYNVKRHLIHVINKCGKKKNYNSDNPTLTAAINSQDVHEWIETINAEYNNLGIEDTWNAVMDLPPGISWIPSHMVLLHQRYATGEINK